MLIRMIWDNQIKREKVKRPEEHEKWLHKFE